jgi:hypothetical protein
MSSVVRQSNAARADFKDELGRAIRPWQSVFSSELACCRGATANPWMGGNPLAGLLYELTIGPWRTVCACLSGLSLQRGYTDHQLASA